MQSLVSRAVPGSAAAPAILLALILALGAPASVRADDRCTAIATGGTVAVITDGGKDYCVHEFTSVGNHSFQVQGPDGLEVDYLIVAGGGGGGGYVVHRHQGGGGGAGELNEGTTSISATSYTITVGGGGAGGLNNNRGSSGSSSSALGFSTNGGGGGGAETVNGLSGGSGGGGGGGGQAGGGAGGASTAYGGGFGNAGGAGQDNWGDPYAAGGGGGAGEAGKAWNAATRPGDGGDGRTSSITGTSTYYAGGGAGGAGHRSQYGGLGGGGNGNAGARANTGGGGGGATGVHAVLGGNGGSGIVIIRYALENRITVTGGSPGVTIDAMGIDAGAEPSQTVVGDGARLQWVSVGSNNIQVKLADTSPALPFGVKLYVKVGSLAPVPVTDTWTTITPSTDAVGDEPIVYSVSLDPMSSLSATPTPVTVDVSYQIQSN